jgi:hypothetical protein
MSNVALKAKFIEAKARQISKTFRPQDPPIIFGRAGDISEQRISWLAIRDHLEMKATQLGLGGVLAGQQLQNRTIMDRETILYEQIQIAVQEAQNLVYETEFNRLIEVFENINRFEGLASKETVLYYNRVCPHDPVRLSHRTFDRMDNQEQNAVPGNRRPIQDSHNDFDPACGRTHGNPVYPIQLDGRFSEFDPRSRRYLVDN